MGCPYTAGGHRLFEESNQRCGRQIIDDAEPHSTRAVAANLDSTDDDRLCTVAQPPSSPALLEATNVGLVDFDFIRNPVTLGANHPTK